jgi:integrase
MTETLKTADQGGLVAVRADAVLDLMRLPPLERLQRILAGPGLDDYAYLRDDRIVFPDARSPVFGWLCDVPACQTWKASGSYCGTHRKEWASARESGQSVDAWLARAVPTTNNADTQRTPVLDLSNLAPMAAAEMRYALFCHANEERAARWPVQALSRVCTLLLHEHASSFTQLDTDDDDIFAKQVLHRMIVRKVQRYLHPVLTSREETREQGILDPLHWGVQVGKRLVPFDLTSIRLRWLRDLTWDWMAHRMDAPRRRPASPTTFTTAITGVAILSDFLSEHSASPNAPSSLTRADALAFQRDWNDRVRTRRTHRVVGATDNSTRTRPWEPTTATQHTRYAYCAAARQVLLDGAEWGLTSADTLAPPFIYALPVYEKPGGRKPRPFPDEVWQVVCDPDNIRLLAELDKGDLGIADVWVTQTSQGRRISELTNVRLDCLGEALGVKRIWFDMTKVNELDYSIPIAEHSYAILRERQEKTLAWFVRRHHRQPSSVERARMALFPSPHKNPYLSGAIDAGVVMGTLTKWLEHLNVPGYTSHQARHTLATMLLDNDVNPAAIKQFMGWASTETLSTYARYSDRAINASLQSVWVRPPAHPEAGDLVLTPSDITDGNSRAHRMLLDLTVLPTEGGLCSYKPVVGGDQCPFGKRCDRCEYLVVTGADYSYWARQRERFMEWAEAQSSDEARAAFYAVWEPMEKTFYGLERALDALGLLDAAKSLDLRSPRHDFMSPLWAKGWSADALDQIADDEEQFDD